MNLYLPRHHSAAPRMPAPIDAAIPVPSAQAARHVVVVEDEVAMRVVIGEVLEDLGHQAQMYENGPQVLAALQASTAPDLLISDVGLPGGLNGRQVAGALRLRYPGLKVLFVTGYDETAALRDGALEEGMSVLTKPFSLKQLATRVNRMLQD